MVGLTGRKEHSHPHSSRGNRKAQHAQISKTHSPRGSSRHRAMVLLLHGEALRGYHPLPAARADLLRKLGRTTEAATAYRAALELASNQRERAFLCKKLTEL